MQHFAIFVENGTVTRVTTSQGFDVRAVIVEDGQARRLVVERDFPSAIAVYCRAARENEQITGLAMACDVLSGAMLDLSKRAYASYGEACADIDAALASFEAMRAKVHAID